MEGEIESVNRHSGRRGKQNHVGRSSGEQGTRVQGSNRRFGCGRRSPSSGSNWSGMEDNQWANGLRKKLFEAAKKIGEEETAKLQMVLDPQQEKEMEGAGMFQRMVDNPVEQ